MILTVRLDAVVNGAILAPQQHGKYGGRSQCVIDYFGHFSNEGISARSVR